MTNIPDSATAVGLLKALFNQSRIGALVEHGLAKELCETTKSSDPISILGSKMEELAPDLRSLLKELLRVFNKVSITFIAARGSRNMLAYLFSWVAQLTYIHQTEADDV